LDKKYHKVLDVLTQENDQVEHEHLSLIFCLVIFNDLKKRSQVSEEIDVENIFKIIDKNMVINRF
jgi:hypothetical protein